MKNFFKDSFVWFWILIILSTFIIYIIDPFGQVEAFNIAFERRDWAYEQCKSNLTFAFYPSICEGDTNYLGITCYNDCQKLGKEYWIHKYSGWTAYVKECYCIKNKEVQRIW